ncbi:hypothetical protein [Bradyrhizobium sp. WD16]|uniref:hypothetical protein n=1 Tax=Bradyrhizobium sp. WD16 TaxID=1521768 RepID=UPI0020A2C942|nr:hypothetical protein [Bradyrhizobium sp. WD16]UTD26184.1 hypothetical protein DB459_03855 [Bradyrhizobium sp. WD16]
MSTDVAEAAATAAGVMIHLRFAPNGSVVEISERPPALTPQEWFNFLYQRRVGAYQAFSGGRGLFRLSRDEVDGFKAEAAPTAA